MVNSIDKGYFRQLAEQPPEEICGRTLCKYNEEQKSYTLSVWGAEYSICPHEQKINQTNSTSQRPHDYFFLFVIYYLLNSKKIGISKEWISEKDMPGGSTFFRGPHEIPTYLITNHYGNDVKGFKKRCEQLDGLPLDMADAAYRFNIAPNIPTAVLYWEGDDDFPPEAKILYDRTITEHLTLDIIFVLAIEICSRIGTMWTEQPIF